MKKIIFLMVLAMMGLMQAQAGKLTIDISGNNTSSDYKSYSTAFSLFAKSRSTNSLSDNCGSAVI